MFRISKIGILGLQDADQMDARWLIGAYILPGRLLMCSIQVDVAAGGLNVPPGEFPSRGIVFTRKPSDGHVRFIARYPATTTLSWTKAP